MATNLLGLAQDHMTKQVRDAAVIQAGMGLAFDKTINPRALDATFPTYLRSALALLTAGRRRAFQTAVNYYGEAKRGAGFAATIPAVPIPQMDLAAVTTDLLVNGPVSIKKQLSTGIGYSEALRVAKDKTLRVGKRHVLNASRQAIIDLQAKDETAVAWARVSDGQPCHFCAMLLSRGPVYSEETAYFQTHNGCGCSARPVFDNDEDDGWSPDARALRELWDAEGGDIASWRKAYYMAVNDPSSSVFKTFTEKVAVHISSPAIVAARRSAVAAYEAQRAAQATAAKAAQEATTKAAQDAALAEAKKAAEEAAKIKKWQGKPAPLKPVEPKPASTLGPAAFDEWLAKVKARYADFAQKTGNYKTVLEKSNNWNYVLKVIQNHDEAALTLLKSNHYIDDALFAEAKAAMKRADDPIPGAAEAYKKELRSYRNKLTRYKRYLEEWREVNGVTSQAMGLDGALAFPSTTEALAWAGKNIPGPKRGTLAALKQYTGGSYREWNNELRKHADPDSLPPGQWHDLTEKADNGLVPAPEDFLVVRGTGWDEFAFGDQRTRFMPPPPPEQLVGTVQTNHGYLSTAMVAEDRYSPFGGSAQLKIRVPKDYPVSFAEPYSLHASEHETILARSTNLYIHAVYKPPGRSHYVVEAEVIPRGVDPAEWAAGAVPMARTKPFT